MTDNYSKTSDADVLSDVRNLWDAGEQLVTLQEERWVKNKKLARSEHLTARRAGQSALFVPKIESFLSRKQADYIANFGGKDPVGLKPTMTSTPQGAAIMGQVLNHYISDAGGIKWEPAILNLSHNSLTYNFAPWFLDWDRDTTEAETDNGPEEVELYSHPTLEVLPPEDIRIDPTIGWDEMGLARFGVIRKYVDKATAMSMADQGVWPELDDRMFEYADSSRTTGILAQTRSDTGGIYNGVDIENGLIEVWYTYYYDRDGEPVKCVSVEDKEVLEPPTPLEFDLRNSDGSDPFPFGVARIYAEPHELYSRAMPEKLEDMQTEVNAKRNQRVDNVNLVLNKEKYMTPEAGVDPAALSRSFPGKVTVVKSPNSVWWDNVPDVTSSAYNEENAAINDMEALVSESAQRMGQTGKASESATKTKATAANTATALGLDLQIFALSGPTDIVEKLLRMVRQSADPFIFEQAARYLRIEVEDAYAEALTGDFRITVGAGAAQAVKDLHISNAVNIAATLQSIYGPQANYFPIMSPMLEANGFKAEDIIQDPRAEQPTAPTEQDAGGFNQEGSPLTAQPTAVLNGGGFQEGR